MKELGAYVLGIAVADLVMCVMAWSYGFPIPWRMLIFADSATIGLIGGACLLARFVL